MKYIVYYKEGVSHWIIWFEKVDKRFTSCMYSMKDYVSSLEESQIFFNLKISNFIRNNITLPNSSHNVSILNKKIIVKEN